VVLFSKILNLPFDLLDISRRLSEMEAQIEALKRDIEDLKTGNEHVNKTGTAENKSHKS
jgi:hypothetical protein